MLTVLQIGYPLAAVGLDAAGGAEQVMAMLDRALTERGHRSIAIACEGSRTAGHMLPVRIAEPFDEPAQRAAREAFRNRITEALERWDIDVVHMHGVDFYEYLPPAGVPTLATLHLPVSFYPDSIFRLPRPGTYLNCVSEAQRRTVPPCSNLVATIENGVPLELFPKEALPRETYALALGRICPEKGFHLALEAADRARIPLWIAGAVFPYAAHQQYFERTLLPRLSRPHRFLGPVGFARKVRLLSRARCLLVPSLAPETSSLVAMESLACGTPVVGFPSGALATLIDHGRTGFLVDDVGEMASAIARCGEIDARECRHQAQLRFPAGRMAGRYIDIV